MSPNVFEKNEDKIYKVKCCSEFYAMFYLVMLKKKIRTSRNFAGPADNSCYWSYGASIILSKRWGLLLEYDFWATINIDCPTGHHWELLQGLMLPAWTLGLHYYLRPSVQQTVFRPVPNSNARATFVQSTRMQRLATSSIRVKSWSSFSHHFVLAKFATSSIRVKSWSFFASFCISKISHHQHKG